MIGYICPRPTVVACCAAKSGSIVWAASPDIISRTSIPSYTRATTVAFSGMIRLMEVITGTFMGEIVPVNFKRFERIEARFQKEWTRLVKELNRAKG